MRLQRFLAQAQVASRRRAEALIRAGAVRVNGNVIKELGAVVDPDRDRVEVEGRRVKPEPPVYRIILKPRACLSTFGPTASPSRSSSHRGPTESRPTLARYVREPDPGLKVVAPLDYPAEGVLLLTTDGDLADALSRRSSRVPMTYHLKLQGAVDDAVVARLLRGWRWEQKLVRPLSVEAIAATGKNTWIEMVVPESRPRALKAAGDLVRHSVLKISRVKLGGISFQGLRMGESRDLSSAEVSSLRRQAGLAGGARPGL